MLNTSAPTLILIISCVLTAHAQRDTFKQVDAKNFDEFLQQTGKSYDDEREREFRESIFKATKAMVDLSKKYASLGASPFHLSLNSFADLTNKELGRLLGSKISLRGEDVNSKHANFVKIKGKTDNLPANYDWRVLGGVTPAGFQGSECGSCWSFATIGALEGHLFRRTGFLISLSQQNLMDCAEEYGCMGCNGGFQEYGFEYVRDHGVSVHDKYPYIGIENLQCGRNETYDKGIFIRDYTRIEPGDEDRMKEVIATLGPLACSMNANTKTFEQYSGGIFDDDLCNEGEVNHSVVVVGYGTENGRDYWIIKNSYSAEWGENGFMKLPRNENSFCGIASECSFPNL